MSCCRTLCCRLRVCPVMQLQPSCKPPKLHAWLEPVSERSLICAHRLPPSRPAAAAHACHFRAWLPAGVHVLRCLLQQAAVAADVRPPYSLKQWPLLRVLLHPGAVALRGSSWPEGAGNQPCTDSQHTSASGSKHHAAAAGCAAIGPPEVQKCCATRDSPAILPTPTAPFSCRGFAPPPRI